MACIISCRRCSTSMDACPSSWRSGSSASMRRILRSASARRSSTSANPISACDIIGRNALPTGITLRQPHELPALAGSRPGRSQIVCACCAFGDERWSSTPEPQRGCHAHLRVNNAVGPAVRGLPAWDIDRQQCPRTGREPWLARWPGRAWPPWRPAALANPWAWATPLPADLPPPPSAAFAARRLGPPLSSAHANQRRFAPGVRTTRARQDGRFSKVKIPP